MEVSGQLYALTAGWVRGWAGPTVSLDDLKKKSLALTRIQTPNHTAHSLLTVPIKDNNHCYVVQ
jgi:hypothetical protein